MANNIPTQACTQLFADKLKIAQVVRNLLSNALQFTTRNDTVCVTLSIEENCDIEKALSSHDEKWHRFAAPMRRCSFLRSPKTYNESFMVITNKFLILEVADSGVGISSVII